MKFSHLLIIPISLITLSFLVIPSAKADIYFGDFPTNTQGWIVDYNDGAVQGHSPGQNGTGLSRIAYAGTNGVLTWVDLSTTFGGAVASGFSSTNVSGEGVLQFKVAISGTGPTVTLHFFTQSSSNYTYVGTSDTTQATNGSFVTYSYPINNSLIYDSTDVKAVGIELRSHLSNLTVYIDFAKTITVAQPLVITTNSLPGCFVNNAYSQTIQATGGQPPYNWTTTSGSLPSGIALSTTGLLSGTPTTIGNYNFTVQVTDSLSTTTTQNLSLSIISSSGIGISNINPLNSSVGRYEKYEVQFDLSTTYSNPFDPAIIDVYGIFTTPTNSVSTVIGFYYQSYTVTAGGVGSDETYTSTGTTKWVIRFAPTEIGTYSYVIKATDAGGFGVSTTITFTSVSSANKGFVRVNPSNRKYLMFDDGSMYFPIGHNVDWSGFGLYPSLNGTTSARFFFSRMSTYHENWDRMWMVPFDRNAIEWTGGLYPGLGRYAQQYSYRWDQILEAAKANGIYVQMVVNNHGQVSSSVNPEWTGSPYNSANGGPVPSGNPEQFFSNTTAKDYFKKRMRYIVARWGYLTNVLAWEMFNEVQWCGSASNRVDNNATTRSNMTTWHMEMGKYTKSIDCFRHLITTSSDDPNNSAAMQSAYGALWASAEYDLSQSHVYSNSNVMEDNIRSKITYLQNTYNKPALMAEFGFSNNTENNFNPSTFGGGTTAQRNHLLEGTHLHNAIWTSALTESMGAIWWWDSYMEINSSLNRNSPEFPLNYHFVPLDRFIHLSLDTIGSPVENLPAYGLLTANVSVSGGIKAFGLFTTTRAYVWFRDTANDYQSGQQPGDIAGRNISGATLTINGLSPSTTYAVQYYSTYSSGGYQGSRTYQSTNGSGQLILAIPSFQRDMAVKVLRADFVTPVLDWGKYALKPDSFY